MNLITNHSLRNYFPKFSKKGLTIIALFFILWLALYVRISWVTYLEPLNTNIGYDGVRYDWIATNLLNKEGFGYHPNAPDSWRPPGYPFFLYVIYSLFGHSIFIVRIVQCFLGTVTCLVLFLLSKKLTRDMPKGNIIALSAAFLYAINFYTIAINYALYTELFNSFLIIMSIYLFIVANEAKKTKFYIISSLASLILWYSVLTRPANILFWVWVGIWFLFENRNDLKRVFKSFLIVIFLFSITVLPWTIRNYDLHKKFLLISSNGGFIFHMAHHPYSQGGFIPEGSTRYTPKQKQQLEGLDEVDTQKKQFQFGLTWIKKNPKRELELIFLKQKRLWTKIENPHVFFGSLPHCRLPFITFHFLLIFAIPGVYYASKYIKHFTLPLFYMINHSLVISFIYFYDGARMRTAMIPILAIFASIGIVTLLIKPFKLILLFFQNEENVI